MTHSALAILAIETADPQGGIAWRPAGSSAPDVRTFDAPNLHAQRLVPMLQELLPLPAQPSLVVVDRGPGSHTGVRIGLACARMLGWQTAARVIGVSSLQVMTQAACRAGIDGPLLVVLPCRGGHVYASLDGGDPQIVDVRDELPDEWRGATAIGQGLHAEARLKDAIAHGILKSPVADQPAWPTPADLLQLGEQLAGSLPADEFEATLSPLYLAGVLARTRAEREAAARIPR